MFQYAYYQSPIGLLKITATNTAITALDFCDAQTDTAAADLYPILQQCITELDEYFAGKRTVFTVAHEQTGSPFQIKVWQALEKIPYGKTCSYSEQANRIGHLKAVRAVGQTNGKNHLPIIVPCHRVIGKSGALVGYAGSIKRKEWLLKHEKENTEKIQNSKFKIQR